MTQADWVKELEEMECTGYTCNHETSETHYLVSKDFISKVESLAQQRTEKKWRNRVEEKRAKNRVSEEMGNAVFRDISKKQNELQDFIYDDLLK